MDIQTQATCDVTYKAEGFPGYIRRGMVCAHGRRSGGRQRDRGKRGNIGIEWVLQTERQRQRQREERKYRDRVGIVPTHGMRLNVRQRDRDRETEERDEI